ncbi:MAG TPA: hypothetical protein V6C76_04890 [Drouetiella sp.]
MKRQVKMLALLGALTLTAPALAQSSQPFFGGGNGLTPPGAIGGLENEGDNGAGSGNPPPPSKGNSPGIATGGGSGGGDYTSDEKRMQRKYKDNLKRAKSLIEKGEGMMKSANGNANHKDYKKGKILKETGEKYLNDLQANNPFPEPEKPAKAGTKAGGKQEL